MSQHQSKPDMISSTPIPCVETISRPAASWLTGQEIQQVDWEEAAGWTGEWIYEYWRNPQGELIKREEILYYPQLFSHPYYKKRMLERVGPQLLDFSREQEWDLGDVVYRTKKKTTKRKEIVANWERTFKVMEVLADKYGNESVRVIAWLDS